jgi:hypothetical protein
MGVMGLLSILTITMTLAIGAAPRAPALAPAPCVDAAALMTEARALPPDVTLFVHVEDAVEIRRELANRPIERWVRSLAQSGAVAKAWNGLAHGTDMDDAELFDFCFGKGFTFASRPGSSPGPGGRDVQWVVITKLGEESTHTLLRKLRTRVREPQFGLAISELPEQQMLLASDGGQVVIGSSRQPELFFDVLQRMAQAEHGDNAPLATLATDADLKQHAPQLFAGMHGARAAMFIRHERPMGGCSLVVADVRGDQVRLRHAGRFDHAPFASPMTKLTCDFSPVALFEDKALVAIVQPRDVGDGPVEAFLSAELGAGLISDEMRKNLADRRLLVVGEHDARQLPEPADILTTTFVAALELKDPSIAIGQLDEQMVRLTQRINQRAKGSLLIEPPNVRAMRPCEPREVDLGNAGKWFTGGFPVMKSVSLNWAVAQSPDGGGGGAGAGAGTAWFVVGSHPQALQETVEALQKDAPQDRRLRGRFDSCGMANGLRLGTHVQSWSDEAQMFTRPENLDEVRGSLKALANLASGMQICRWQLARPTENTMRLDVQVTLTAAETAEPRNK